MRILHIILYLTLTFALSLSAGSCTDVVVPSDTSVLMPLKLGNMWIGRTPMGEGKYRYDTLEVTGDTIVAGEQWFTTRESLLMANRPEGFVLAPTTLHEDIHLYVTIHFPAMIGDTLADAGEFELIYEKGEFGERIRHEKVVPKSDTLSKGIYEKVKIGCIEFYSARAEMIYEVGQSGRRVRHLAKVTSSDTLITVPAGTFRCLELTGVMIPVKSAPHNNRLWNQIIQDAGRAYIAPGIGIVKTVGPFVIPLPVGRGDVWELVEAHI
jgi:hypothetical protein